MSYSGFFSLEAFGFVSLGRACLGRWVDDDVGQGAREVGAD